MVFTRKKKQLFVYLGLGLVVALAILLPLSLTFFRRDGLAVHTTLQGHHAQWVGAAVDQDKTVLVAAFDTYLQAVDLRTGEQSTPLNGGLEAIDALAVSPNGTFLAASSHTTRLWRRTVRGDAERSRRATDFSTLEYEEVPLEKKTNQNGSPIVFDSQGKALYFLGGRAEMGVPVDSIYKIDPATGQVADTYDNELFGRVREFALSPNDTTFALTDEDHELTLFDSSTWEFRKLTRSDATDAIRNLTFSPDGKLLAASTYGGNTVFWDVVSGREQAVLSSDKSARKLEFSRDGSLLFRCVVDQVDTPIVEVWRISDQRYLIGRFAKTRENCLTFLPSDQKIVSQSGKLPVGFVTTNRPFLSVIAEQLGTVANYVTDLAYTPDAKHLITLGRDENLQFWNMPSGTSEETVKLSGSFTNRFTLSPDNRWLVLQGVPDPPMLWNVSARKPVYELQAPNDESLLAVAFSPEGDYLAGVYSGGAIVLWQVQSGDIVRAFRIAGEPLRDVAFQHSSGRLVVLTETGWLYGVDLVDGSSSKIFRAYTNDQAYSSDQPDATVFSPQGSLLGVATATESDAHRLAVTVWDTEQQEKMAEFSWPHRYVDTLSFSPNGALLAVSRSPFIQEAGRVEVRGVRRAAQKALGIPVSFFGKDL